MAKLALVSFDPLSGNLPDCPGPLEGLGHANGSCEFYRTRNLSEINFSLSETYKTEMRLEQSGVAPSARL
jgi:hypothetical protein